MLALHLVVLHLVALALCPPALAPPGPSGGSPSELYSVRVLPSHLPTAPAIPAALSGTGEAVGFGIESLWTQGAHWPDATTVVDLAAAHGLESSAAYAVGDDGAVYGAGSFDASVEKETAFAIDPAGVLAFLPQLVEDPGIASAALAVSPSGLVAGSCDTVPTVGLLGNPHVRATLWEDGVPRNLGTLGGDVSLAYGVNDAGTVVGISNLATDPLVRAFAWTEATGMVQLPGLAPGARSWARDVNAHGLAVGDADSGLDRLAVAWPDATTVDVLPLGPADHYAEATAVNDHGQVVGRGRVASGFAARLWQGDAVHDLDALTAAPGLTISEAVDVNARGQVLAIAWDATPSLVAVLLTPDLAFEDLGQALPGAGGAPRLAGYGNLLPDGPVVLEVADALPGAPAWLAVGFAELGLPLLGGTLVPDPTPPGFVVPLAVDAAGGASAVFLWPAGVPAGFQTWTQAWILDPGGPQGVAATNALRSTAP